MSFSKQKKRYIIRERARARESQATSPIVGKNKAGSQDWVSRDAIIQRNSPCKVANASCGTCGHEQWRVSNTTKGKQMHLQLTLPHCYFFHSLPFAYHAQMPKVARSTSLYYSTSSSRSLLRPSFLPSSFPPPPREMGSK